ncbi:MULTISPECIES: hypothetical protein [Bradyrhizobium]|uniref:hypothetical protein n=1 Tax=Bradyrhizobium TaxID=374 RepID=UPI001BAA5453|nr:hypothetical protein [Bradyrhizobium liaoningense]MBR0982848.1 hypothetical protein [Bradyrhizobium liaoningense]GMP04180.1 hypothetical protein TM239_37560 [Bradyrhizobium sp. TM239]
MRKLILIATVSLLTSQAYAGGSRSLSLAASNSRQQASEQPATAATVSPQTTQAPSQPANVQTATTSATAPAATTAPATKASATPPPPPASTAGTTKPKRRQLSTDAQIVRALHRHGIYW